MRNYLNLLFSVLCLGNSHHSCGIIRDEQDGYIMDFTRTCENTYEAYGLMEDIKNGCVESTKYSGCEKILKSRKIVIFSNSLPNMKALSMDRWSFFHTKLGEVFLSCATSGSKAFKCSIVRDGNKCDPDLDPRVKPLTSNTDRDFINEYLELFNVLINWRVICDNRLAFPTIDETNRAVLRKLWKQRNAFAFEKYVSFNRCLENSIVSEDFLKCSPLYLDEIQRRKRLVLPENSFFTSEESSSSDEI